MVVYLYRWKLINGKEEQFKKAWSYVTEQIRSKCGSLGSRLHLGNDGIWYGYAQWPNAEQRSKVILCHEEIMEARRLMKDSVAEDFPEIELSPMADFLI